MSDLKDQASLLRSFAQQNGYDFTASHNITPTDAAVFFDGDGYRSVDGNNVVLGNVDGKPFRSFVRIIYSGRDDEFKHKTSILEFEIGGALPNLLLNKGLEDGYIKEAYGIHNKISLQSGFDTHFTLYGLAETHVQALQVFSPDVMQIIQDNLKLNCSMELVGSKGYFYVRNLIDPNDLASLINLAQILIRNISPVAEQLQNDPQFMTSVQNLHSNRHRKDLNTFLYGRVIPGDKKRFRGFGLIFILLVTLPITVPVLVVALLGLSFAIFAVPTPTFFVLAAALVFLQRRHRKSVEKEDQIFLKATGTQPTKHTIPLKHYLIIGTIVLLCLTCVAFQIIEIHNHTELIKL